MLQGVHLGLHLGDALNGGQLGQELRLGREFCILPGAEPVGGDAGDHLEVQAPAADDALHLHALHPLQGGLVLLQHLLCSNQTGLVIFSGPLAPPLPGDTVEEDALRLLRVLSGAGGDVPGPGHQRKGLDFDLADAPDGSDFVEEVLLRLEADCGPGVEVLGRDTGHDLQVLAATTDHTLYLGTRHTPQLGQQLLNNLLGLDQAAGVIVVRPLAPPLAGNAVELDTVTHRLHRAVLNRGDVQILEGVCLRLHLGDPVNPLQLLQEGRLGPMARGLEGPEIRRRHTGHHLEVLAAAAHHTLHFGPGHPLQRRQVLLQHLLGGGEGRVVGPLASPLTGHAVEKHPRGLLNHGSILGCSGCRHSHGAATVVVGQIHGRQRLPFGTLEEASNGIKSSANGKDHTAADLGQAEDGGPGAPCQGVGRNGIHFAER
mmetsp:Transcript_137267/g.238717  ORF Transcript_137267/g.238717 Transcript_137267/m.238717 type:complete len:429 (-) Transcript_137267:232-1518(-)